MKCIICGSSMNFFFSKQFRAFGLDKVEYWRCQGCGFVLSKTHAEMAPVAWEKLNCEFHGLYQGTGCDPGDPRWLTRLQNQALMLCDAADIGLLNRSGRWLDYACGDGSLSYILRTHHNLRLLNYDRYMPNREDYIGENDLVPGSFDFVITTSVFEHFTRREQFDAVEVLLSKYGVLGIHTLVCESVPADPTWFYMNPVHCAFHTNASMEILFRQWGYTCSVYNAEAQLWLWFKNAPRDVDASIRLANSRTHGPVYILKSGFVDYWKCIPIRRADKRAHISVEQAGPENG